MTATRMETELLPPNPLDVVEQAMMERDWAVDRPAEDELVAEASGIWCNYRIWFGWQPEMHALLFSCAFDSKVSAAARPRLYPLLALVNEKLWLGHFDMCQEEGAVMFRHALLVRTDAYPAVDQLSDMLDVALAECERFYPAFQSVLWGKMTAEEALEAAIFDTVGEA